jgi:carotenoid cleavage dioxygenase
MRWFRGDPCYVFHPMNAFEENGKIIADVMQFEAAPVFPDPDGKPGDPAQAIPHLTRWTFDLAANTEGFKCERIDDLAGEFPRLDERFAGLPYRHGYFAASAGALEGAFDRLAHIDLNSGERAIYRAPAGDSFEEPIFVPRRADAPEGDGWLLAVVYRGAEKRSDLAVFDAASLDKGPIAVAELSHRIPFGFHGNWRAA